jgi:hypothetical protein
MRDYLGNELFDNDKVICVVGRHLRKSFIESLNETTNQVTIKGLKNKIWPNFLIKLEWQETVK